MLGKVCMNDRKAHGLQPRRYLRAAPMKIFAGHAKTVYYVHPEVLLAHKSSTASVRMSGSWKDTGEGVVDWTDFDEQIVECVLNYLYTGDYHVPFHETGKNIASTGCMEDISNDAQGKLSYSTHFRPYFKAEVLLMLKS